MVFDRCRLRSIPISSIARFASGWIGLDHRPALQTSKRPPACLRRSASAIWLRHEFVVQKKRTLCFLASAGAERSGCFPSAGAESGPGASFSFVCASGRFGPGESMPARRRDPLITVLVRKAQVTASADRRCVDTANFLMRWRGW